jgi:excisionase family DNA binding protein
MCAKTIRRLIDRGELRQHRFGRAIRVSEDDLAVFIKTRRE